jgi:iron complex transport system substrate-binding protein
VELAPDAIITMQNGRSGPPSDPVSTVTALAQSPALKQNQIIEMNGLYLLGFGPRCASAARELMAALYPELMQKRASAGE